MKSITSIILGILVLVFIFLLGTVVITDKGIHHFQEKKILAYFDDNLLLLQLYTENRSSPIPQMNQITAYLNSARSKDSTSEFNIKRMEVTKGSLLLAQYYLNLYADKEITQTQKKEAVLRCVNTYKIATLHQFLKIAPEDEKMISTIRKIYSIQNKNYEWEIKSAKLMRALASEIPKLSDRVKKLYH